MVATSQSSARGSSGSGATGTGNIERPKLRDDLLAEAIEEGGQKFVDVGDPDGTIFRFYEVEFSLACAMDGERDVKALGEWAKDELGLMPSLNEIRKVIATLGGLGYLAAADAVADAGMAPGDSKIIEVAPKSDSKPTATQVDGDLAPGITVGAKPTPPPVENVELGHAGASATSSMAPEPKAAEIALGAPGASATSRTPKIPVEDVALGTAGAGKDVSLDLADHIAVSAGDVKEAVRASKVMQAVDVPKDLLDALEDKKPVEAATAKLEPAKVEPAKVEPAKVEPAKVEPKPVAKAEPVKVEPAKVEPPPQSQQGKGKGKTKGKTKGEPAKAATPDVVAKVESKQAAAAKVVDQAADTKPSNKSKDVAVVKKDDKKPTAPAPKTSRALVYLLLLVVLAAGAFAYYWYIYKPAHPTTTAQVDPAPITTQPAIPDPGLGSSSAVGSGEPTAVLTPAPLPDPKSKLEIKAPPQTPVTSVFPGTLDDFAATGLVVKKGNQIGRLSGYKPSDAAVKTATATLAQLTPRALAAVKARDAARTADPAELKLREGELAVLQKKLDEAALALEEAKEARSKFDIVAPVDGTLNATAKVGMAVTETTILGSIDGAPIPLISFDVPDELRVDVGTAQAIKIGDKEATCAVFASEPGKLTLNCPTTGDNAGLVVDGAEATWHNPNAPQAD